MAREKQVVEETVYRTEEQDVWWAGIEPYLNQALAHLSRKELDAVLLHFFDNRTIKETGVLLGISEGAAQMRISRSLEKLRKYFIRHGVAVSSTVLLGLLTARSSHAVPASLVDAARQATIPVAGEQISSLPRSSRIDLLTKGVLRTMWIHKMQVSSILLCLVLLPPGSLVMIARNRGGRTPH